jgi:hypothetical protein
VPARPQLLSLGDRVRYDGREHTVAALHGTSVRLVDDAQAPPNVLLLGHLLASEGFAVLGSASNRPPMPDAGALEGCPRRRWSGRRPGPDPGALAPRPDRRRHRSCRIRQARGRRDLPDGRVDHAAATGPSPTAHHSESKRFDTAMDTLREHV